LILYYNNFCEISEVFVRAANIVSEDIMNIKNDVVPVVVPAVAAKSFAASKRPPSSDDNDNEGKYFD
jgi:hypothetical protein